MAVWQIVLNGNTPFDAKIYDLVLLIHMNKILSILVFIFSIVIIIIVKLTWVSEGNCYLIL